MPHFQIDSEIESSWNDDMNVNLYYVEPSRYRRWFDMNSKDKSFFV